MNPEEVGRDCRARLKAIRGRPGGDECEASAVLPYPPSPSFGEKSR
jgi:hypothetical protein